MDLPFKCLKLTRSLIFYATIFFNLTLRQSACAAAAPLGNETDKIALLKFKSQLDDPHGILGSWNESVYFCRWVGVTCGRKHQRVTALNLQESDLAGPISSHIANLSFLQYLNLSSNSFAGGIPAEIGRLFRLRHLDLSHNNLGGVIPANLSHCSNLANLVLDYSHLKGQIPPQLGSLLKLVNLSLSNNNLTGSLPASFANLSSLELLNLLYNKLEGKLPEAISQMRSLKHFHVGLNNLSGKFPASLYNLSSLETIILTSNSFSGDLKPDIGLVLPNLRELLISDNNFTGPIPNSLSNASNFRIIDLVENSFTGNIPMSFGLLQNLEWLNVWGNHIGAMAADNLRFLIPLTNCSELQLLDFSQNQLVGELPNSLYNLSTQLNWLGLGGNYIVGRISADITNLINLTALNMEQNMLTGNIPASMGQLSNLGNLFVGANKLTGEIPSSFANLSQLLKLSLYNNSLEGSIPSTLEHCTALQELLLCHNKFNGTIPVQLLSPSSNLVLLNVSHNSLTGSLPPEVSNLQHIVELDVSYNKLAGDIPKTIKACLSLEQLYMQGNSFQGTIPDIRDLRGIQILDLSNNKLSGPISDYMGDFSMLQNLNLSYNNLEGEVPVQGIFRNVSAFQVYNNSKLCGGIKELHLRSCPQHHSSREATALMLILVIGGVLLCLALISSLGCLRWVKKSRIRTNGIAASSFGHFYPKISYEELLNATCGFSPGHVIGSGHFGTVYQGILGPDETVVAVKVLNLQHRGASKSFLAECQALRNIRHRNLVPVLTVCASSDFTGNEFKALVYKFMPNGSLDTWLHPEEERAHPMTLNFIQRLEIAVDVACALHYLHDNCQTPVIHCDLKPSNVLLDNDMTAHVSDFGLAKLLSKSSGAAFMQEFSSAGVKGTVGYAAPEYGIGERLSTQGDVYSFGIMLLELFTGKRPTDQMFQDNLNLHNYSKQALAGNLMQIISQIDQLKNEVKEDNVWKAQADCLISVLQIGVACSAELPINRMKMKEVVHELLSIKDKLLGDRSYDRQGVSGSDDEFSD